MLHLSPAVSSVRRARVSQPTPSPLPQPSQPVTLLPVQPATGGLSLLAKRTKQANFQRPNSREQT
jgi:hypothetical protein